MFKFSIKKITEPSTPEAFVKYEDETYIDYNFNDINRIYIESYHVGTQELIDSNPSSDDIWKFVIKNYYDEFIFFLRYYHPNRFIHKHIHFSIFYEVIVECVSYKDVANKYFMLEIEIENICKKYKKMFQLFLQHNGLPFIIE